MKNLFFLFIFILFDQSSFYSQIVSKKAGICFRTDDDQPIERYVEYSELFNLYGKRFTCAINFGKDQITPEYINMLHQLQQNGHEVMDHTPWHSTVWFSTKLGTEYYIDHPGVERIDGNNIELKHEPVNILNAKRNGIVDISGDIVTSNSGIFSTYSKTDCYLFFPFLDKLVFINEKDGWIDANNVKVEDFWGKETDLGIHNNVQFYNFDNNNVHLTIDAIKALAEESLRIVAYYNLERPYSWIQPGGKHPYIHKHELMQALSGELSYKCGGIFPNPSLKVFNEYNPDNDKQFGMNFGDFRDDIWTLEECKHVIADKIAKHQIAIGHSHFTWTDLEGGWEGFLERTEGLIQWCIQEDIPIRTYTEWADILYEQNPNPYENIFPPLNIDLDNNSLPDGYYLNVEGELDVSDGAIDQSNYCYSIADVGNICIVEGLGGLEKGENEFSIWTKGSPGNFIEVDFKIGTEHTIFKFPAENSDWTQYNQSQSINENRSLFIPEDISLLDVSIKCSNYTSGTVKVSCMSLMKRGIGLQLKVLLQGSYANNSEMATNLDQFLPVNQPYNVEPWSYNGSERLSGEINSDIVDWVLVSIKNDIISHGNITRKAALLRKDGLVLELNGEDPIYLKILPGNYYVQVEHRNHLKIISADLVTIE